MAMCHRRFAFSTLLVALLSSSGAEAARPDLLIQKRYPGVAGAPASRLFVDGSVATLEPLVGLPVHQEQGVPALRYLVVADEEFLVELARHRGYEGKPANHIEVRGVETVILKASEIDRRISRYPGLSDQPANHVMIDGVHTVLVKKSEYIAFLRKNVGIADLPENYILLRGEVIQVIPVEESLRATEIRASGRDSSAKDGQLNRAASTQASIIPPRALGAD